MLASGIVALGCCAVFALAQPAPLRVDLNHPSGQPTILEGDRQVLRYNYRTVSAAPYFDKVTEPNRIYCRDRSDYIHPLFGLGGEEMTRDFALDHPHHRGIYWAWPELGFGSEMGDLHALQRVFARPTGRVQARAGEGYAEVEGESVWQWDDVKAIALERAIIRAYGQTAEGRLVDLTFVMTALEDGVTLARRGTEHYGGLNVRLATIADQQILWHTDPAGTTPRMAWEVISGTFSTATAPSALVVMQHPGNPDYPGDWVKYPELNWSQPTFPASGTRYAMKKGVPLTLRYRLWIRPGGAPDEAACAAVWRQYATPQSGKR